MNGLDLLYAIAGVVTAPVWSRKQRGGWSERFGHVEAMLNGTLTGDRPRVLVHAVSVGEVAALRTLVPVLAESADVIVSTTTDTGLARARELYAGVAEVVRYPLDFSGSVRRFLDVVRPDAVGLVELELWPNFLGVCAHRGIPVAVINGRLSERSHRRYARFRRVVGAMLFGRLEAAAVQDEAYADRFVDAGVPRERVRVTGTMKWDSVDTSAGAMEGEAGERARDLARAMGVDLGRPVIVAGSTGPGEEALVHAACPAGVQLVCAPRKPERFDEAAAAMAGCVRRSSGETRAGDRFLLDTIGELGLAYRFADLVVIGRSFGDLYGSDPIEAAAMGKAVVIGRRTSDFAAVVAALRADGAIVETDRGGLGGVLAGLMADGGERSAIGERARACVRARQGASARHAELLMGLVG